MLALDDKRWSLLGHAYGRADDVPAMIEELKRLSKIDYENDLLYSFLCHQTTTYSATYAAVPHIAEIAFQANQTTENKRMIVEFCGMVHAFRNWNEYFHIKPIDESSVKDLIFQIEDAYLAAIKKIKPLAEHFLINESPDETDRYFMFYTFLAFEGFGELSRKFIDGDYTEFHFECPYCEYEHFIHQDGSIMIPDKRDYDFALKPAEIKLPDSDDRRISRKDAAAWALFHAEKYDVKPVKYQIPYLFGKMVCPNCDKEFRIIDALH